MVTADRIIDSQVKETRVRSLLDEVQKSNHKLGKGFFEFPTGIFGQKFCGRGFEVIFWITHAKLTDLMKPSRLETSQLVTMGLLKARWLELKR